MAFPTKVVTQLYGSNGPVHALAYSSSPSTYILTGSSDRSVRLYNPSRPAPPPIINPLEAPKATQLIQTYSAHGYEVLDISVAQDNATFASVGGDRSVFFWDVSTAQTIRRFGGNQGHSSRINTITFAGTGDCLLISGGFDTTVRIWDVKSNNAKPIMVLDEAGDSISCVLAGNGEGNGKGGEYEVMSGSVDGRVRTYDVRMGKVETDVVGTSVTSLSRTRDGKGVLVGGLDSSIRLMDRDNGGLLKTYKHDSFKNNEFRMRSCFGGNERWVLCGNEDVTGADGQVIVWDTLSGNVDHKVNVEGTKADGKKKIGRDGKIKDRQNVVSCVAWKEDGRGNQWCCGGTDGVVTVFGIA